MTRDNNRWVTNLFGASAVDWTPAPTNHAAHVLYAPVSREAQASWRCASVLSDLELQRAHRFVTDDSRAHFVQRRAFRRYCGAFATGSSSSLSRLAFQETNKGRPYLSDSPDVWFSFSACQFGFLGAWSSKHRIGVDIEDRTRNLEAAELAQQFFSHAEETTVKAASGLARLQTFYRLWTLKEAALKSIGEGLPFGPDAFEFELGPFIRVARAPATCGEPEGFNARIIERNNLCAALVIGSVA
jgi:phosphopantetheinyl transferase